MITASETKTATVRNDLVWQFSSEDCRELLRALTGVECVPCEGGVGVAGHASLDYYEERSGKGYRVLYSWENDFENDAAELRYAITRHETWDRHAMTTTDAIAFDTPEEYEAQCRLMEEGGLDKASRAIWEACKADAEEFWRFEERIRDRGRGDARARSHNRRFVAVLDTYGKAFEAIGCHLSYEIDMFDPCERVHTVSATGIYGNTIGHLRSYGHDGWWD